MTSLMRGEGGFRMEDPLDFPFYAGTPVSFSAGQWVWVLATVLVGFAVLALPVPFMEGTVGLLLKAMLFAAIPLAGLVMVAGRYWTAIFRPVGVREFRLMLGFWLLNLLVSLLVGYAVFSFHATTSNPVIASAAQLPAAERVLLFVLMVPQLLGEELLTLLPFLAALYALHSRWGLSRTAAMLAAWLGTSLVFAAAHLPTYNWNFVQCFLVIGSARLVLTLAFIKTKNIWVSMGAHVLTDWGYLAVSLMAIGYVA